MKTTFGTLRLIIERSIVRPNNIYDGPEWAKFYHISGHDLGKEFVFTPRTPKEPYEDLNGDVIEDNMTKRVSWEKTINDCIDALDWQLIQMSKHYVYATESLPGEIALKSGHSICKKDLSTPGNPYGVTWELEKYRRALEKELGEPISKTMASLDLHKYVPDANETNEYWATKPVKGKLVAVIEGTKLTWLNDSKEITEARSRGPRAPGGGIMLQRVGGLSFVKQTNDSAPEKRGLWAFVWPYVEPFLLGSTNDRGIATTKDREAGNTRYHQMKRNGLRKFVYDGPLYVRHNIPGHPTVGDWTLIDAGEYASWISKYAATLTAHLRGRGQDSENPRFEPGAFRVGSNPFSVFSKDEWEVFVPANKGKIRSI